MQAIHQSKWGKRLMYHRQGTSCHIVCYEVQDPDRPGDHNARRWLGRATAHVFDANRLVPQLTPSATVLTGEVIRTFEGRSIAPTEADALREALDALLFQLTGTWYPEAKNPR